MRDEAEEYAQADVKNAHNLSDSKNPDSNQYRKHATCRIYPANIEVDKPQQQHTHTDIDHTDNRYASNADSSDTWRITPAAADSNPPPPSAP